MGKEGGESLKGLPGCVRAPGKAFIFLVTKSIAIMGSPAKKAEYVKKKPK